MLFVWCYIHVLRWCVAEDVSREEGAVHTKCRSVTREIRARLWPVVRFRQQKHCGLGWTETVSPEKQINCVWTVTTALVPPVSAFRNLKFIYNVHLILTHNKKSLVNQLLWLLTRHTTCFMYTWDIFHMPI